MHNVVQLIQPYGRPYGTGIASSQATEINYNFCKLPPFALGVHLNTKSCISIFLPFEPLHLMGNLLSSQRSPEEDVERYRKEADRYAKLRNECFSKSQALYRSGDKKGAKEESEKGKEYGKKMEAANQQAAEVMFQMKNSSLPQDKLDLHGLYVKEALAKVEERVKRCKREKHHDSLTIIVGLGNHSTDGVQKLRPAVEAWLKQQNLNYTVDQPNRGCLLVDLKSNQKSSCIIC
ncbi:DUF1771-domain-containing protein [Basidiobolus meristosporus CBS 931.73]|uniref:DUF1771-domain-containing protein n=1 Tax=Basidiobolus meristosporus CBS 931.73 TaxID=1314790 RepID=A0A1Y1YNY0_9FUNG|nr:DUF1771-domain-containing protein [Basidiobolus meristosporus CBS 931.73]|eukprot:ORX99727.1 DUF1771-domain-containing protein [Basidiobolus meristosporus CBS 931.73]